MSDADTHARDLVHGMKWDASEEELRALSAALSRAGYGPDPVILSLEEICIRELAASRPELEHGSFFMAWVSMGELAGDWREKLGFPCELDFERIAMEALRRAWPDPDALAIATREYRAWADTGQLAWSAWAHAHSHTWEAQAKEAT